MLTENKTYSKLWSCAMKWKVIALTHCLFLTSCISYFCLDRDTRTLDIDALVLYKPRGGGHGSGIPGISDFTDLLIIPIYLPTSGALSITSLALTGLILPIQYLIPQTKAKSRQRKQLDPQPRSQMQDVRKEEYIWTKRRIKMLQDKINEMEKQKLDFAKEKEKLLKYQNRLKKLSATIED